jgi:hypothetical protein
MLFFGSIFGNPVISWLSKYDDHVQGQACMGFHSCKKPTAKGFTERKDLN